MLDYLTLLATAAPGSPVAQPSSTGIRLIDYVRDGGLLSYILIGLSIVALTSVIYNLLEIRLTRQSPPGVFNRLEQLFREGRFREAEQFCAGTENDSFMTRVVGASLARCLGSPFGMMEFRSAVENTGPTEVDRLHRNTDLIGIIAAVGPMLGLLGTVIGMIGAFRTIGTLSGTQRSNELATFMSMALVNTAEGLVVAIPCTIAFALFRRKIDEMVARMGTQIEALAVIAQAVVGGQAGAAPGAAGDGRPAATASPRATAKV